MKTLELPEPARRLWLETRDALSALDPTAMRRAYTPWLGGGTLLAARWRHRLSTDIDVVIRDTTNLEWLQRDDDRNIARRLAARVEAAASGRIKLRRGAGLIDLNTAPVSPRGGGERVRIDGRAEHVLSTTQIFRGKFNRAARPGPVRDVYDVLRAAAADEAAKKLSAAFSLLGQDLRIAIKSTWAQADRRYEREADTTLALTEEPVCRFDRLGSSASRALDRLEIRRIVIELADGEVTTEQTTKDGRAFTDVCHVRNAKALYSRNGVEEMLNSHGCNIRRLMRHIEACRLDRRNGVVFDNADTRPWERLDGTNRSMKRSGAPRTATVGRGDGENPERGGGEPPGG